MTALLEYPQTVSPTAADARMAKESSRTLARFQAQQSGTDVQIRVQADDKSEQTISIPESAFRLLTGILNQMALGNAVALIPVHAELTTQEAADIINVSRPFLIKLLAEQKLPFKKVGTHRRILFSDLMEYKKNTDAGRIAALQELAEQAQDLNMGY